MNAVLADLQGTRPIPLTVSITRSFSDWREEPGWGLNIREPHPGGRSTSFFFADSDEAGESVRFHLAWQLTDQFFPESDAAWAQARPECPGHTHPATAEFIGQKVGREILNGEAWWVCPADRHRIKRIGAGS